jgi:hypothetical protein
MPEQKLTIPDWWWDQYLKKYERLMYKISHMISGDPTICSIEDNFGDLCVAAIESVEGFIKKTKRPLDTLLKDKQFDQYTKTCLWKRKARKGLDIEKKRPIRKCVPLKKESDTGEELDLEFSSIACKGPSFSDIDIKDIFKMTEQNKEVLDIIVKNPSVLKMNGTLNFVEIGRILDVSSMTAAARVKKLVYELQALGIEE